MQGSQRSVFASFSFRTVFNKVDLPTPVFPNTMILKEEIFIFKFRLSKFVIFSSENSLIFFGNFSLLTIL